MTTSVRGADEVLDSPSTDSGIHEWRAGSFGAAAREYVQYRPTYPAAAICWGMTGSPGAPQGCDPGSDPVAMSVPQVVDLGAGTGKLTGGLLLFGAQVVAVEPDERMRAETARLFPPVRTLDGRAERIPLPDGSADAVFIGQALHCFDFDKSLWEIHRVLHRAGVVTALWNHNDDSVDWVAEFSRVAETTTASRRWADASVDLPGHSGFTAFERRYFPNPQRHTAQTLVRSVCTQSHLLLAAAEERRYRVEAMHELLASDDRTARGEFDLPMVTTVIRAVRR
ncbi:class I SAM-dependent methyltransferase [Nocardia sp. CA-107356]|uniref:class I SAM-dependent methyltransferase n=1 Tax=Nocardia sp. CA-107356 TaxID=3239972 RepID=UPI003D939640